MVALAALLVPGLARASNPWLTPLGSEAAMSGGAVAAMGRDTGNAYYNPAGLGASTRAQFDASSTLAILRHRVIPGAFQIDLPNNKSASSELSSVQPLLLATSIFYTRYLGRGVTLGGGHFANNYDYYDYTGSVTDLEGKKGVPYDARVQVDGWSTRHYFGPTVGWQIRPRIRVGMSLFVTYEWQRDEGRIWAQAGEAPDKVGANYITGDLDVKRSTYGFEAVLGLQWEFVRNFHLGFAVRTPRLVLGEKVRRYQLITRGFEREDGTSATQFLVDEAPTPSRRGMTAAVNFVLGLGYALPRDLGWVSVEADYSPALQNIRANVDLRHTVNARLGARIRAGDHLFVGLGAFTDRNSQSTANLTAQFPLFVLSYYGGSMGVEFRRSVKLGANERARDIQFLTAIALRYAYGVGVSGAVRFDLTRGAQFPVTYTYDLVDPVHFHVWGGHLGTGFFF
jgi:hypothetical protein